MHLKPVTEPRNLMVRLAYFVSRRRFGHVLAPFKVLYARKPSLIGIAVRAERIERRRLKLDPALQVLIKAFVSIRNGCSFCADLTEAQALKARIGEARFSQLAAYTDSSNFSASEKAALAYVDEYFQHGVVSRSCYEKLAAHFDDTQIVEITWLNAIEQYYNALMLPLGITSEHLSKEYRPQHASA